MPLSPLRSIVFHLESLPNQVIGPQIVRALGQDLVREGLSQYYASGMTDDTGNLADWIQFVGEPEQTANGWRVGVMGGPRRTGRGAAPRGTIGAFLRWYGAQARRNGWPQYRIRGGVPSAVAWRMLSHFQKEELQRQRLAGRFGGQTAAGVGKASYALLHEFGKGTASIASRHFIDRAIAIWRTRAPDIIRQFYAARP